MDAVVIGAGPNGLTAAATLARHGWQVLVLEAQRRPGGAAYSEALTLPGFVHDVGAAFFPFADDSPAFRDLDLTGAGLQHFEVPPDALVEFDGDPAELPYADGEFDDVVCHGMVDQPAFAEVARVLKPGGHFVVTFAGGPDDAGHVKRLRRWFAAAPGFGGAESDLRTSLTGAGDRLWAVWAPKSRQ